MRRPRNNPVSRSIAARAARRAGPALIAGAAILCAWGCADRSIEVKESPVILVSETVGTGDPVRVGDLIAVAYTISTMDGRKIQEFEQYRFQAGMGHVVTAMDEAVIGMREGGRRVVEAAPQKHWGRAGYGDVIPPTTRLIFDIQVLNVE